LPGFHCTSRIIGCKKKGIKMDEQKYLTTEQFHALPEWKTWPENSSVDISKYGDIRINDDSIPNPSLSEKENGTLVAYFRGRTGISVSTLIMLTFRQDLEPIPSRHVLRKDGDSKNNRADNLIWGESWRVKLHIAMSGGKKSLQANKNKKSTFVEMIDEQIRKNSQYTQQAYDEFEIRKLKEENRKLKKRSRNLLREMDEKEIEFEKILEGKDAEIRRIRYNTSGLTKEKLKRIRENIEKTSNLLHNLSFDIDNDVLCYKSISR
jgi:hypothetical protein